MEVKLLKLYLDGNGMQVMYTCRPCFEDIRYITRCIDIGATATAQLQPKQGTQFSVKVKKIEFNKIMDDHGRIYDYS